LFPGSKIQFSVSNCDYHLSTHNLSFDMSVCIVFARIVMPILLDRGMGRNFF
jgi:hypothetical protein